MVSPDYLTPLWAIGLPPLQRATASRDTSPVRQAVLHPVQIEISGAGLDWLMGLWPAPMPLAWWSQSGTQLQSLASIAAANCCSGIPPLL